MLRPAAIWLFAAALFASTCANAAYFQGQTYAASGGGVTPTTQELDIGAGGFLRGVDAQYDGTNPETILTRADTYGAYIWNAGAAQWQQVVTSVSMPVADLTVDNNNGVFDIRSAPSNTNTLYMSYQGYVYVSSNRGAAWTKTTYSQCAANSSATNGGLAQNGPWMAVDPVNPSVVYMACISGNVQVTTNGGTTWANAPSVAAANANGAAILFDSSGGTTSGKTNNVYIIVAGTGVYKSTNAGTSFSLTSGGPTNFNQATAANGDVLVCPNDGGTDFVWYNGSVWATVSTGNLHNCQGIAVNPGNANEVIVMDPAGRSSISTTGPSGTQSGVQSNSYTFTATDIPWLGWAQTAGSFADVGQIMFDPVTSNKLYVTGGIGVWTTTPSWAPTGANAFTSMSLGIEQLVSHREQSIPGGPSIYLGDDRPVWYLPNYGVFPSTYGPSFNATNYIIHGYDVAYQPGNPSYVVGIFENTAELSGYSNNGGQTWTLFPTFPGGGFGGTGNQGGAIAVDSAGNIVWSPTNTYPYVSQNGGQSWTGLTALGTTGWSFADYLVRFNVTADKVAATTFYAFNYNTGVWKSTNGGTTWAVVNATTFDGGSPYNAQFQASPTQSGYIWFTSGPSTSGSHPVAQSFYVSTNGGTTWATVPGNVQEVRAFGFGAAASGHSNPSMYIVGWVNSVYGIWESDDATLAGTPTWTLASTWPLNSIDDVATISGNLSIYGEYIIGFSGSGAAYGHTSGWVQKPTVYNQTPTPTTSSATIAWSTTEAASYVLNYGTTTAYGSNVSSAVKLTSQTASLSGLSNYTTYHFDIVATDASSNTFTSYDETFTTLNSIAPNAPTSVSATNVNDYSNSLTWTANQGSDPQAISGNYVYRSSGGAYTLVATIGAVTSYTDLTASPSTTYTYKIAAFDPSGNVSAQSAASNSATTPSAATFAVTAQPATLHIAYATTSATFTSQSVGTAVAGREVLVFVYTNESSSPSTALTGVSVCGNAATNVTETFGNASQAEASIWEVALASGTSCSVVVTAGNNIGDTDIIVGTLENYVSVTPVSVSSWTAFGYQPTAALSIGAISVPSSGVVLAFSPNTVNNYVSWSGVNQAALTDSTPLELNIGSSYVTGSVTPTLNLAASFQYGAMVQLSFH